jgi:hypothetical protein
MRWADEKPCSILYYEILGLNAIAQLTAMDTLPGLLTAPLLSVIVRLNARNVEEEPL